MKKRLLCLFLLTISITAMATGKVINQTIAIVNNDVITSHQLDQALKIAMATLQTSKLPTPDEDALKIQVLQQLIFQSIATQLAQTNHITASNQEVEQAIASIAERNQMTVSMLKQKLSEHSESLAAYQAQIKRQIIIHKLEQQAVAGSILITPEEVSNFLKTRAQLKNPDTQYQVAHILLALPDNPTAKNIEKVKKRAEQLVKKIKAGLSFKKAAITYSQSDDAMHGGVIPWSTANQLPTVFEKPILSMSPGDVVGPIENNTGFHILKLLKKRSPTKHKHYVEQFHIQQIFIKTSPILSATKAHSILKQIKEGLANGQNFTALAKRYSQDNGNDDLGWLTSEDLPQPLAKAISTMPVNAISKPIVIGQSWYLIKLLGKRKHDNTKQYLEQQARQTLFQQRAAEALQTWRIKIMGESYIKILDPKLNPSDD